MARKVVWTHEADADLGSIADYIAKDSTFYAAAFVREIQEASLTLRTLSERGRIVPEVNKPTIREIFVRDYRLIYEIDESRVAVLAFIHGARDLKKMWLKKK